MRVARWPSTLKGKVVGFLDGWGTRNEDGSFSIYPLMAALKDVLIERVGIADTVSKRRTGEHHALGFGYEFICRDNRIQESIRGDAAQQGSGHL